MSHQTLPEISTVAKKIMGIVDPMPREKKNSFSAHKSRIRKKAEKANRPISEDEVIIEAAQKMGILSDIEKPEVHAGSLLKDERESMQEIGGRVEGDIHRNVINFPAQSGLKSLSSDSTKEEHCSKSPEETPIAEPEMPVESDEPLEKGEKAPEFPEEKVSPSKNGAARFAQTLFEYRYFAFKLVCYSALVPASSKAVHAFFQGMNLYGNGTANLIFAIILTASVDLLAIDMLTRAASALKTNWKQWPAAGLLCLSLGVIGLNIGLTLKNMENDASFDAREKLEREWKEVVTTKEKEFADATAQHAAAEGSYLATKWAGNADPKACEGGAVNCRGPFTSRSIALQSETLAAETKMNVAKSALDQAKKEKPVETGGISQGVLDLRIWFYSVLWGFIVMASIASPRKK